MGLFPRSPLSRFPQLSAPIRHVRASTATNIVAIAHSASEAKTNVTQQEQ